jgi:Tol biopolymer transport system component
MAGWGVVAAAMACLALPAAGEATFPGANGKIAYEGSGVSGSSDTSVFSMNGDGTAKTNLTPTAGKAPARRGTGAGSYDPSYSANGRKIVFERVSQGTFRQDIWVMNADGTGQTNVTNTASVREEDPALSPDGTKIVFAREPDSGSAELFVMNADGSGATPLTGATGLDNPENPEFSPDGSKIAFDATVTPPDNDILTINANGQGLANLTSAVPGYSSSPSWAPDGTRIAFSNLASQAAETNILVVGRDGGAVTDLTGNVTGASVGRPAFSPDGNLIAYERDDGSNGNSDIFTMNSTTGLEQTNITSDSLAEEDRPSWGPVPDTAAPETTITKQPQAETEKTKAKLAFTSSEPGSTFECALKGKGVDKELKQFKPCDSGKVKYKHLEAGKKKFQVRATDAEGNVDATPAKAKWKVL